MHYNCLQTSAKDHFYVTLLIFNFFSFLRYLLAQHYSIIKIRCKAKTLTIQLFGSYEKGAFVLTSSFEKLEALIDALVASGDSPSKPDQFIEEEVPEIEVSFRKRLINRISEQRSLDDLALFVQDTQVRMTVFTEKVYAFFEQGEKLGEAALPSHQKLLFDLGMKMTDHLNYLRVHYSKVFNESGPVSPWVYLKNKQTSNYTVLLERLNQRVDDEALLRILEDYLSCLHNPKNTFIQNWRQYFYLQDLAKEIDLLLIMSSSQKDLRIALIRRLIGFNFNPLVFYEYLIERIADVAGDVLPYEVRELELLNILKGVSTIRTENEIGLLSNVMPLRDSICGSIEHDLANIARMKTLSQAEGTNSMAFYFMVSLTLEQLLFFFRLTMEEAHVRCKYHSHLYAFISRHIRVQRSESPSEHYMRNVFSAKEVPQKVVRAVRAALMTLVNRIDSTYLHHDL